MLPRPPPSSGPMALPKPAEPSTRAPASAARSAGDGAPRREQHPGIGREAAECGKGSEDPGSDEEDVAPAEHVGEPAAGHDQHAEHQGVAGDDPLHRGDVGIEILLDRRQCDRECCEIIGDHQDGERHRASPRICALLNLSGSAIGASPSRAMQSWLQPELGRRTLSSILPTRL